MHPDGLTPFEHLKSSPEAAKQFSNGMNFFQTFPGLEPEHLLEAFDFSSLEQDALMVDIGGSHGGVSFFVARSCPNMRCIVQDLPVTIAKVASGLPEDLKERVSFMAHDFFQEQPVKDADVYYFRWIFHDWSDLYSRKILKGLVPAMKPGAKLLINDVCMPEYGQIPEHMQKRIRYVVSILGIRNTDLVASVMDLTMKSQFNAKERDEDEWKSLLLTTDPRFHFESIWRSQKSRLAVIIATWKP